VSKYCTKVPSTGNNASGEFRRVAEKAVPPHFLPPQEI